MAWRTQRPALVTDLNGVQAHCRTDASCRLVAGYAELLAEGGGALPAKNGLDLRRFAAVISSLVLVAVSKPDRCIYRLAGENVQRRIGLNPAGRNYYDFVPEVRRARAMHAMNMAIDVPCGFRAEIEQTYSDGLVRLIEALALPLVSAEPGVDGFILFADCHVEESDRFEPERRRWQGSNVLRRDLIDLGHGVDETFEDIVPA